MAAVTNHHALKPNDVITFFQGPAHARKRYMAAVVTVTEKTVKAEGARGKLHVLRVGDWKKAKLERLAIPFSDFRRFPYFYGVYTPDEPVNVPALSSV